MQRSADPAGLWRVLVVEDEALIAEEVQDRLVRLGCQVAGVADTGPAAIDLAGQTMPDLVLMDIQLKGPMDGIAAAQEIFRRFDVPVVFLTAHSDQETFQRTQMEGTFGYLLKPFHARDLSVAMAMAVSRFRMDRRVRESEHTYGAIVNSIADAALVTDSENRIRSLNPAAAALTGWELEQAVGRRVEDVLTLAEEPAGSPVENPAVGALRANSMVPLTGPLVLRNRQGAWIPVEGSAAPTVDSTGKANGAIVVLRDITGRRLAEEELRQSHAHLEASQHIARVGSWELELDSLNDLDSNASRWSRECFRLFGYESGDMDSPTAPLFWARVHPEDEQGVREEFYRAVAAGEGFEVEHRILLPDGAVRHIRERAELVRDPRSGRPLRFIGTAQDVTEQRQVERALRDATSFLQAVIETSPSMIFVLDAAGKALLANRATAEYYRTTPEQLVGRATAHARTSQTESVGFVKDGEEVLRTGRPVIRREWNTAPDGARHWFHTVKTPLARPDGSMVVLGISTDITSLVRAEEALRESEARLRSVVEGMPILLVAFDDRETPAAWNRECERVTGYLAEEIVGNPRAAELLFPDKAYREWVLSLRNPGNFRMQLFVLTCKNGTRRTIEWSSVSERLPIPGWAQWSVGVDVTGRLSLEEELRQAQKMQALGQLAGGVAHDFNNLLTVINGYSDMLFHGLAGQKEWQQKADQIRKAGSSAAAITDQLMAFSQNRVVQPEIVDLNKIVHDCGSILKRLLGEDVTLEFDLAPELRSVLATVTAIEQVLVNLAANARDAMPEGGRLTIRTRNELLPPGSYVKLTIQDSGQGIPPGLTGKIFEPFFTTKEIGKGTGMGLATVYGVVKQRGGWVDVESEIGNGATFHVYLPAAQGLAPVSAAGVSRAEKFPITILLAEDETAVRELCSSVLESCGSRVLVARGGAEALEIARRYPGGIDLLVSDIAMPKVTGPQLFEQLRREGRDVPVLFISGYPNEEVQLGPDVQLLAKPFLPDQLMEAVARTLKAAG